MTKTVKYIKYDTATSNFSEKSVIIPDSNELTPIANIIDIDLIDGALPGSDRAKINECITAINSIKNALVSFGLMNESVETP